MFILNPKGLEGNVKSSWPFGSCTNTGRYDSNHYVWLLDTSMDAEKRHFRSTWVLFPEMANKLLTSSISRNYTVLGVLGVGCYGDVLQCLKWDTNEMVAVKVFKQKCPQNTNIREVSCLMIKTQVILSPIAEKVDDCFIPSFISG